MMRPAIVAICLAAVILVTRVTSFSVSRPQHRAVNTHVSGTASSRCSSLWLTAEVAETAQDGDDNDDGNSDGASPSDVSTAAAEVPPATNTTVKASARTKQQPQGEQVSWQADLDELLNPFSSMGKRQARLFDLISAREEIQKDIQTAINDRTIEPLLTPRAKKVQEGTRAVARQISNDILPALIAGGATAPPSPPSPPSAQDFDKFRANALALAERATQTFVERLQNPSALPQEFSELASSVLSEVGNVFAETPSGLKEPPYKVVSSTATYEIRDYQPYTVASTRMETQPDGDVFSLENVRQQGVRFNALASYLFGANSENKAMAMTTPVATTMSGEMRFYLADDENDDNGMSNNTWPEPLDATLDQDGMPPVQVVRIPAMRLAVRRFTGFCTSGEVERQKETLLAALSLDGIDVPEPSTGGPIPYYVFQYNPPYTVPIVRRNEVAVEITQWFL